MMKNLKYFIITITSIFFLYSCTPENDDLKLENTINESDVILSVSSSTPGGNEITLKMETPGVTGYWDYNIGKAVSNEVTFIYPIFGTSTFTYIGTLGGDFFSKTVEYTVQQIDHPVPPEWALLAGDTSAGKNWIFDGSPGDGNLWWYMCPPSDPTKWQEVWWNAGGTGGGPNDVNGKMHFDLNGNANYIYYADPNATGVQASFSLDVANQTIKINDANILGAQDPRGNPDGIYHIISLTQDKLILYTDTNPGGTGWVWVFKKE